MPRWWSARDDCAVLLAAQSAASARTVWCRHSLSRLWVPHSSFHSAAQEPPRAADVLNLAEDRLDGLLPQGVAGLARLAGRLGLHGAARRPSLLDAEGLPSLRGLPWRPCLAGGISSSGALGMVVRLSIDQ